MSEEKNLLKKEKMAKIALIIIGSITLITLLAFLYQAGIIRTAEGKFKGKWESTGGSIWTFQSDTVIIENDGTFSWSAGEGVLVIESIEGVSLTFDYEFEDMGRVVKLKGSGDLSLEREGMIDGYFAHFLLGLFSIMFINSTVVGYKYFTLQKKQRNEEEKEEGVSQLSETNKEREEKEEEVPLPPPPD